MKNISEVAADVVISTIKKARELNETTVDWDDLKREWEEYFEYIENKGVVLGLHIARKNWGEGNLNDLIEEQRYYQDLVDDVEGKINNYKITLKKST
ncbi:MAG: hypothetical protein ACPGVB_15365 [Chitinophagales bacterium]